MPRLLHRVRQIAALGISLHCLSGQGGDQSNSPVLPITVDGKQYLAQKSTGRTLHLSVNECFFDGRGLRAIGEGAKNLPGADLNKRKMFAEVRGLSTDNSVSWYLHVAKPGTLRLSVKATGTDQGLRYRLGSATGIVSENAEPRVLEIAQAGVLRMRLTTTEGTIAKLGRVTLEGSAIAGASLLRARWRPAAAHTRFTASTLRGATRVWVMEMDAAPGAASFYAPMTTPFGYFGASWSPAGRPTGLNFSMWSYGRGKQEPPIEKLSHLIAIGDPKGSFSGFGHEGTGVKPRNCNPFLDWPHQSVVFALRMVPGTDYDTYYGYYFEPDAKRWQLYAAGRKTPKRRRDQTLWAGSFVEVPGPPQRQRSGHIVRRMRYRGFTMDSSGRWHAFDTMRGEGKPGQLANRGRGLTADGRFEMWMGGMAHAGPNPAVRTDRLLEPRGIDWMEPTRLAAIMTVPTVINLGKLSYRDGRATLSARIQGLPQDAKVTVFYGPTPGRTFAERWAFRQVLSGVLEGEQTLSFTCPEAPVAVRLLVQHTGGQYWSL